MEFILNPINRIADDIEESIYRMRNNVKEGVIGRHDPFSTDNIMEAKSREGVELDLVNVFYSVVAGKIMKRLLINANLHINSGEMCAIMGPSGSGSITSNKIIKKLISIGKSTLMDLIAERKSIGHWSGHILINNLPRKRSFKRMISYVLQDDMHIASLTVLETLRYASWTRLPHTATNEERDKRVEFLLEEMGLTKFKDTLIGNEANPGITGGTKKRVSIAVEIMSNPTFIFLDEPTSGLDSSISLETMKSVRRMIDKFRICLCTIHQPSKEIFSLFDRLILVSAGRIVYSGKILDVPDYFTELGYPYQDGINPAEYMIDICATAKETPEQLQVIFDRSDSFIPPCDPPSEETYLYDNTSDKYLRSSFHQQFYMLFHRSMTTSIRDRSSNYADIVKNIFFGFLVGFTFFQSGNLSGPFTSIDDANGTAAPTLILNSNVLNFSGLLFFILMFQWYGNTQAIPVLCQMDALYRRELSSGAYSVSPYALVSLTSRLPVLLAMFTIFYCIMYPMVGFPSYAGYFFLFYIILFLSSIMSYFVSMAVAGLMGDAPQALGIVPPLFVPYGLFCGYPIILSKMNWFWAAWGPYFSFMRWTFEAYMVNEFVSHGQEGGEIIEFYDFRTDFNPSWAIWILLLNIFCVSIITIYALQPKKSKLNRVTDDIVDNFRASIILTNNRASIVANSDMRSNIVAKSNMRSSVNMRSSDVGMFIRSSTAVLQSHITLNDECIERFSTLRLENFAEKNKESEKSNGITLTMINLSYIVPKIDGSDLPLLKEINGTIPAGKMVAIMGGSGAGKSTLLNVLRYQLGIGKLSGHLLFNGQCFNNSLFRNISFVPQSDIHLALLTVKETLYYSAELRIGSTESIVFKEERVKRILEILELTNHANTIVGNAYIKGISGGQKRRLSIGVEIITFPGLIILDEPTTGLDCALSNEVMASVKNLSLQNRTVVCTIHQPSPGAFALFDMLILLAGGRLVYLGPSKEAVAFFSQSPFKFQYQAGINPADYVVAVAGSFMKSYDGKVVTGEELTNFFESVQYKDHKKDQEIIRNISTPISDTQISFPNPFYLQTRILLSRYFKVFFRNSIPKVTVIRAVIVSVIIGTISDTGAVGYPLYIGAQSFCFYAIYFSVITQIQAIPVYFQDLIMLRREKAAKVYLPLAYWMSIWIVYLVFLIIPTLFYVVITYFTSSYMHSDGFFLFFAVLYLSSLCAYFLCNILTNFSPNPQTAVGLYPILTFVNVLFSGYFQYVSNMQTWLKYWVPNISFMRWGYQCLICNIFTDNPTMKYGNIHLQTMGFSNVNDYQSFLILLEFTIVFFIVLVVKIHFF